MKKSLLKSLALVAMTVVTFSGCKKDENGSPSISIIGDNPAIVTLNGSYTDEGATATDPEDGAVAVTSDESLSNPDVDQAGDYTITYTATDADGNTTTAKRTVTVRNDAYDLAGAYTCTTPGFPAWQQTITVSTTKNNEITFSRFEDLSNNNTIKAIVSGASRYVNLNPLVQTASGVGTNGCTHEFTGGGSGQGVTTTGGNITFTVKYSDTIIAGGSCSASGPVDYEDTFVKN